jgi:hypothetical protein
MFGGKGVESSTNTATTAKVPAPRQSDTTGDRGDTIGDGATSLQHVIGGILPIGLCLAGFVEKETTRAPFSTSSNHSQALQSMSVRPPENIQLGSYSDELSTTLPCPHHAGTMWNSRES